MKRFRIINGCIIAPQQMKIAINFNYGEYCKIQLQTLKKLKYLFWSNLREELTRWRKKNLLAHKL